MIQNEDTEIIPCPRKLAPGGVPRVLACFDTQSIRLWCRNCRSEHVLVLPVDDEKNKALLSERQGEKGKVLKCPCSATAQGIPYEVAQYDGRFLYLPCKNCRISHPLSLRMLQKAMETLWEDRKTRQLALLDKL